MNPTPQRYFSPVIWVLICPFRLKWSAVCMSHPKLITVYRFLLPGYCEIMRGLGYPRLISMENFRVPNFELVADCLEWLVKRSVLAYLLGVTCTEFSTTTRRRPTSPHTHTHILSLSLTYIFFLWTSLITCRYDPQSDIVADILKPSDRVFFLQSVGRVMYTKARVKLNLKRLYAADGNAVKELLKVAKLLDDANKIANDILSTGGPGGSPGYSLGTSSSSSLPPPDLSLNTKMNNVKQARALSQDIIAIGARLHDALLQEPEMGRARTKAITDQSVDSANVQRQLREMLEGVNNACEGLQSQLGSLEEEVKHVRDKVEKKGREFERAQQRLAALQAVKPAYMEEYERLQMELQGLYLQYAERQRNIDYLNKRLTDYQVAERDRMEAHERRLKRMQMRMKDEQIKLIRGDGEMEEDNIDMSDAEVEFSESDEEFTPRNGMSVAPDAALEARRQADKQRNGAVGGGRARAGDMMMMAGAGAGIGGKNGAVMGRLQVDASDDSGSDMGGLSDSMDDDVSIEGDSSEFGDSDGLVGEGLGGSFNDDRSFSDDDSGF